MIIQVELHTMLQQQSSQGPVCCFEVSLPDTATVNDLLALLEIRMETEHLLLVVNRMVVEADHILNDGDKVDLIPAMSGG